MSNRFEICSPRKGKDDKTHWVRIGTAWQNEKGIQLVFDALPIPDAEGRCTANLFEPREKSAAVAAPRDGYPNYSKGKAEPDPFGLDDSDVPF